MTGALRMSIPSCPAGFCSTHDIRSLSSRRDISLQRDSRRLNVFSRRGAAGRRDSVSAASRPFPLASKGRSWSRQSLGMMQNDALGTHDIVDGVGLAFALVVVFYLLPSTSATGIWRSTRTADDFEPLGRKVSTRDLLHDTNSSNDKDDDVVNATKDAGSQELDESTAPHKTGGTVFGEASWKEISRRENYVYFNSQLRDKKNGIHPVRNGEASDEASSTIRKENRWILPGLLLLFVPIFSFELALNISRQLLCNGNTFTQLGWAQDLCIPHV
jgi:hypothetical protein